MLWLVEEEKRYTTKYQSYDSKDCCGLLKKRKDIQQQRPSGEQHSGCGLLKKRKDIQH